MGSSCGVLEDAISFVDLHTEIRKQQFHAKNMVSTQTILKLLLNKEERKKE